jgi:hypothetical protein
MPDATFEFSATKRAAERLARAVDFAPALAVGDTIASQTVTATDSSGADVTGSLISSPGHSGTQVNWTWLPLGTAGDTYFTRIAATTANGEVLARVVRVSIVAP